MPLKPLSICQLSLLSIPICLSLQTQVRSTELSLHNTHIFSQQDLIAQDRLSGPVLVTSSMEGDPLTSVLIASESDHSSRPAQTLLHPNSPLQSTISKFKPSQTSLPPLPVQRSGDPAKSDLAEREPQRTTVSSSPTRKTHPSLQPLSDSEMNSVDLPASLPTDSSFTIDQITQVPEVPTPEESAGRRPSIRTQPTIPGEAPLDLREDLLTPKIIYSPSTTILTPSAYGKSWRQASVGFGFQHRTRFTNSADGAFGVGLGLGDARKYVGLDVGLTLTDLDNFDRGIISFKLHRRLPDLFAVAVGVNDAISWGPGDIDGPSPYGVVSKTFVLKENTKDLFNRVYVSAGLGTGRYRTENNVFTNDDTPGIFGSVALRVADPINMIAEWSGQNLSLGFSLRPFREIPLIITPAITDVTGTAGDGVRFIFGIGYAITF